MIRLLGSEAFESLKLWNKLEDFYSFQDFLFESCLEKLNYILDSTSSWLLLFLDIYPFFQNCANLKSTLKENWKLYNYVQKAGGIFEPSTRTWNC